MNINESIRDWINHRLTDFPQLANIQLATGGEEDTVSPPFFGIYETGSEIYEQDGATMYGVSVFEITAELHTVPVSSEEGGTEIATERGWRNDLYNILGDRDCINWMSERNGWRIFDIRLPSPTTEAGEGERISRFTLEVTACPN